ncbi:MAG: type I DNA topoisomerase [Actinomycetes bacterium]
MSPNAGGPVRRLVIVESPAKAKTIAGYLGPDYIVEASVGHIRDLPDRAGDVPEAIKKEPWGRMGVDVTSDFKPYYVVSADKRSKVAELKAQLKDVDELLLATDEDREGEAISWHLLEVLKPKVPVKRMVFHEITREAILRATQETRDLDTRLVDAQECRRIVDRLYGFEVSPVLWRKMAPGLSAGRVQSVATRLVVRRERERIAFRSAFYWDLSATFDPGAFAARLTSVAGKRVATGNDFGDDGLLKGRAEVAHLDEGAATELAAALAGVTFVVAGVDEKPGTRKPSAPFMTSTLQQEASRKLRWGAQRTMRVAQGLYERGFITYMRTDSTTLSESAVAAARAQATALYGAEYVSEVPRRYDRKVKNAQEAHEAIRPSGDVFRTPAEVAGEVIGDEYALYDLIWKRTVASQMVDARVATTTIRIGATASDGRDVEFRASGTVIVFAGFLAAYEEGTDDDAAGEDSKVLPLVTRGDRLSLLALGADSHATSPPARYTEATLVKALEEAGIGRPSTYASIMSTIVDRGYVWKRGSALVPAFLAFAVVRLLEEHFFELVDTEFTARMEEILDQVAEGQIGRNEVLRGFYFGDANRDFSGLHPLVSDLGDIDARAISSLPIEGSEAVLRVGRYGPYLELDGERANVPTDLAPDELTAAKAAELLAAPSGDRELGIDPETGYVVMSRVGRYGPYVTEVFPTDELDPPKKKSRKAPKPRTSSLFKDMDPTTVTLPEALRLLTLPRLVGIDPADEVEILAHNGRYGPYLAKDKDSRSLADEEALFTVTLDEALALFASPKPRRGRGVAAEPLRRIGVDPSTQSEIVVRDGRFGAYVTDGVTNASLRRADDPMTVSLERAADLLAERRATAPAPKKSARRPKPLTARTVSARKGAAKKPSAKKAAAKKPTAKKTAGKKAAAKKAAAKKPAAAH